MSSSKLSTTLPHDNVVTFFKMAKLLHFCNKIENGLCHLSLNLCSFDLPSASTDFFDKSSKNLSASFPQFPKCLKTKGTNFGAPPVNSYCSNRNQREACCRCIKLTMTLVFLLSLLVFQEEKKEKRSK